ncbi:hypothetical protein JKG47_00365 [Acidithiobacillus sp. MC6.1]|nr:hypothetical protein [Acidithiobacillus sp. MC6.1]
MGILVGVILILVVVAKIAETNLQVSWVFWTTNGFLVTLSIWKLIYREPLKE